MDFHIVERANRATASEVDRSGVSKEQFSSVTYQAVRMLGSNRASVSNYIPEKENEQ